ncbi:MAG: alpha/beta hydrolase [Ponticaulis sp.]|nr:alpha/beta hydrolase [Ponticaulis sp.]|tara:strand:+ start:27313 stop:28305 length:993 start_codon:yes stop_codon:yes gene_type:complete
MSDNEHTDDMPREVGPLSQFMGDIPPSPDWFSKAISTGYETRFVRVKGARVHYQSWSSPNKPGLLLVHGNGAHAHWYDFIAPYFAKRYNVVAMTFSGMGESDWRENYDMDTFSEEQIAVCEATGMFEHAQKPIIVAHSFGGFVTILTGARYGHRLEGTVIVDSPVNPPERERNRNRLRVRGNRVYPDLTTALGRFRLAPEQPCDNHFAMDYIARWSLKQVDNERGKGWSWRFDPDIWQRFEFGEPASELLRKTACRIALFRGEESEIFPDEVRDYMEQLLDRKVPFVSIPHAYHHVMLDQPLAFVSALRALLADWDHSAPNRAIERSEAQ